MRPRLQLDFVAAPRRARWIGMLVLAASAVAAVELVLEYHDVQQRLQALDATQSLLATRSAPSSVPRERLEGEMKAAQATVRQLALPWPQLIDSLERAALKEVAVLHIQPDAQSRVVRVTAAAREQRAMLEYLRRLGGGFADVHLVSHHVREDEPQRPIQFSVQASFRAR